VLRGVGRWIGGGRLSHLRGGDVVGERGCGRFWRGEDDGGGRGRRRGTLVVDGGMVTGDGEVPGR